MKFLFKNHNTKFSYRLSNYSLVYLFLSSFLCQISYSETRFLDKKNKDYYNTSHGIKIILSKTNESKEGNTYTNSLLNDVDFLIINSPLVVVKSLRILKLAFNSKYKNTHKIKKNKIIKFNNYLLSHKIIHYWLHHIFDKKYFITATPHSKYSGYLAFQPIAFFTDFLFKHFKQKKINILNNYLLKNYDYSFFQAIRPPPNLNNYKVK